MNKFSINSPSRHPDRTFYNKNIFGLGVNIYFLERLGRVTFLGGNKTCDYTKSPYCIIKALYNAAKGNMKKGYAFAGSNAFLAEKISSVKEVMSTLEREFFLATHKLA